MGLVRSCSLAFKYLQLKIYICLWSAAASSFVAENAAASVPFVLFWIIHGASFSGDTGCWLNYTFMVLL